MASAPAAAPPPPPTAPVAQVTIKDVQSALQSAGYYKHGTVDGVWGRMTQRAVTSYQRDHKLTASGKLDVPTLQALNLTGAPPSANPGAPPPPASDTSTATPSDATTAPPPANGAAPPPAATMAPPADTTTTPPNR